MGELEVRKISAHRHTDFVIIDSRNLFAQGTFFLIISSILCQNTTFRTPIFHKKKPGIKSDNAPFEISNDILKVKLGNSHYKCIFYFKRFTFVSVKCKTMIITFDKAVMMLFSKLYSKMDGESGMRKKN